jgi:hypothetical protein
MRDRHPRACQNRPRPPGAPPLSSLPGAVSALHVRVPGFHLTADLPEMRASFKGTVPDGKDLSLGSLPRW